MSISQIFDDRRYNRDDDDCQDNKTKILLYPWHVAKIVTDEEKTTGPCDPAQDIVTEKPPVRHVRYSGHKRGKGTDDRDETCKDNRFTTVLFVKPFSAF